VAPPHAGSGAARAIAALGRRALPLVALAALVVAVDGSWATAQPAGPSAGARASQRPPAGAARPTGPITAPTAAATAAGADDDGPPASSRGARGNKKEVTGKLNLNTATEEQLLLLPTVGPSKAERIVAWRKRNGAFKRVADLRRVKGFGYKTFKRLEPYLAIQGDTTLAAKQ
jgi:competence protein ComEA